jgi:hypothetical protein
MIGLISKVSKIIKDNNIVWVNFNLEINIFPVIQIGESCLSRDSTARFGRFFNSISPRLSMGQIFEKGFFDNEIDTIEVTRLVLIYFWKTSEGSKLVGLYCYFFKAYYWTKKGVSSKMLFLLRSKVTWRFFEIEWTLRGRKNGHWQLDKIGLKTSKISLQCCFWDLLMFFPRNGVW